jgi:1-acyl-sn-glycerol-3-phosphate acyltransferase
LFAKVEIHGGERFPGHGPLIIVGNHTGAMEVVMMTLYCPRAPEYLGSIDIPHEPYIGAFIGLYGFIPVHRGAVSLRSMRAALEVLEAGGVLGLFPEGGIWEPAIGQARTGVAWLSYHGGAPVLPIGFGSTRGALGRMLRLGRPRLTMRVGELLPPVRIPEGRPRMQVLREAANGIMERIWELVPEEDQEAAMAVEEERFELQVTATDAQGRPLSIPDGLRPSKGPALSKFIHRTTLFKNLEVNVGLPIGPLSRLHEKPGEEMVGAAVRSILGYLEGENPYYFTYRYGQQEGTAMEEGIRELGRLAAWAEEGGFRLEVTPLRVYREPGSGRRVVLRKPREEQKW